MRKKYTAAEKLIYKYSAGKFSSKTALSLSAPTYCAKDVTQILNFFFKHTAMADKINKIIIIGIDLSSYRLDFTYFKHLTYVQISSCMLTDFPALPRTNASQLHVDLSNNSLSVVPSELFCIDTLEICSNPLTIKTLEYLAEVNKIHESKAGNTFIVYEIYLNEKEHLLPQLQTWTLQKLVEKFADHVENTSKSIEDIININLISVAFCRKNKDIRETTNEVEAFMKDNENNPYLYTALRDLLKYVLYFNNKNELPTKNLLGHLLEHTQHISRKKFMMSKDVCIPDWSFLSGSPTYYQFPLGKPRKDKEDILFPKGLLVCMPLSCWSLDYNSGLRYMQRIDKKAYKVRLDANDFQLRRKSDEGLKIPSGNYTYSLTPNGGLIIAKTTHSTYRAGQYVVCAGHIDVENGKIIRISNASGHYQPPFINLIVAAAWLYSKNFINLNCHVNPVQNDVDSKFRFGAKLSEIITHLEEFVKNKEMLIFLRNLLNRENSYLSTPNNKQLTRFKDMQNKSTQSGVSVKRTGFRSKL